jgi:16S rRNA (adenine(1408)-N(1))-methyltransferase
METIQGKTSLEMNLTTLQARLAGYQHTLLDLGTGDGRFARCMAEQHPAWFVIGLDACRENLHANSRAKLPNLLFVIANAQTLPAELHGLATHVTINFPWGSLLMSLLENDSALMNGLLAVAGSGALVDVRLNGGALAEAGFRLDTGAAQIRNILADNGFRVRGPVAIGSAGLRAFPSTWARRLACGRDPRALGLNGRLVA